MTRYDWTAERIVRLRELWLAGDSAGFIAVEMGPGLTRNSVIGKAHRIGLTAANRPAEMKPKKLPAAGRRALQRYARSRSRSQKVQDQGIATKIKLGTFATSNPTSAAFGFVTKTSTAVATERAKQRETQNEIIAAREAHDESRASSGISIFDIGADACRWPLNEASPISQFRFCGAHAGGSIYCVQHGRRAYAKQSQFLAQAAE